MHQFWGDFIFTVGVSIIFSLAFEFPTVAIEKILFNLGNQLIFELFTLYHSIVGPKRFPDDDTRQNGNIKEDNDNQPYVFPKNKL